MQQQNRASEPDVLHACNHLSEKFEEVCNRYPHRIAVSFGQEHTTYAALHARAGEIAGRIAAADVSGGALVAIWLDRSSDMVAAMLGVLMAGCAYVPLDPGYPPARILETIEDAGAALLITFAPFAKALPGLVVPTLLVDVPGPGFVATRTATTTTREDIAYLMYTSGSTGKPKGVLVTHGNVLRLFEQTEGIYGLNEQDVWTVFHSFAFDFSVWEIYGALLYGGRMVIVPFEVSRTPDAFYVLLAAEKVTVLNQTPSAFRLLLDVESGKVLPLSLRLVIFGGEALSAPMLRPWFARHCDAMPRVFNMYGITETTVHVTFHQVKMADTAAAETPMGAPLGDLSLYLLDEEGNPTPAGDVGELYVSGAGVARGYHNRPVLTAERFLRDPFRDDGTVMYRSGDLARVRQDGALVYAGRGDDQVKINGFRMEMGEIETALAATDGVQQACIIATGEGPDKKLVAYFVMKPGGQLTIPQLAASLAERLPPQMMPSHFVPVEHMPLTPNGKVDRRALPGLPVVLPAKTVPEAEQTELEKSVLALVRDTVGAPDMQLGDNFFAAGVESLQSTRLAVRVRERFDVKLTLRDLFEAETLRDIAARIEELVLEELEKVSEEEAGRLAALDRS